jgi:predicted glycogen debranching enzyme
VISSSDATWNGPVDGPWPVARVDGDLDRAESEWLITNDVGTYAMSTLALMHTRRQHGLLVTRLGETDDRFVLLSHLEMTLEAGGRTHHLSTHQFPSVAPTPGYRELESYTEDPLPRWVFRLPSGSIERTLCLVKGRPAVVVAFSWQGKKPARLLLRPLMPMRSSEELTREHGSMLQRVVLRSGEVEVQPVAHLPPLAFRHSGVFMGSPDWWRRFEYLKDRGRYTDFQEDMWSPGVFELTLEPRETQYLVVSVGEPVRLAPAELVLAAVQERLAYDREPGFAPEVRALSVAAESFVYGDGESIFAGYPWLGAWSRDTLMSIRGIYLARGQVARARRTFQNLLDTIEDGLLPQIVGQTAAERGVSADASLWLFDVGKAILDVEPGNDDFAEELRSALLPVFLRVSSTRGSILWLDDDGLVENQANHPLTWMDSRSDGIIHTPRWGLAVELQALWARACQVMAALSERAGDLRTADAARKLRERVVEAFKQSFWCFESNYPFDCMGGRAEGAEHWADPAVRPNALIAQCLAPDLFEPWQRKAILSKVEERLLTGRGLRTLDPADPRYRGHGGGTVGDRKAASHQGTVWPHLLLYYVRASLAEGGDRDTLREWIREALRGGLALGHVAQAADGDFPHRHRGCPAYAMATAMLLEALVVDLHVQREGRALW